MFIYVMAVFLVILILSVFLTYLLKKNNLLNFIMLTGIVAGSAIISIMFPFILNLLLNISTIGFLTAVFLSFLIYITLLAVFAYAVSQLVYSSNFEAIMKFIIQNIYPGRLTKEFATTIGNYIYDSMAGNKNYSDIGDKQETVVQDDDISIQRGLEEQSQESHAADCKETAELKVKESTVLTAEHGPVEEIGLIEDPGPAEEIELIEEICPVDEIGLIEELGPVEEIRLVEEVGFNGENTESVIADETKELEDAQESGDGQEAAELKAVEEIGHVEEIGLIEEIRLNEEIEIVEELSLDEEIELTEQAEAEISADNVAADSQNIENTIGEDSISESFDEETQYFEKKPLTLSDKIDEIIEEVFLRKQSGDLEGTLALYLRIMDKKPANSLVFWLVPEICLVLKQMGQPDFARFILNDYVNLYGDLIKANEILDYL